LIVESDPITKLYGDGCESSVFTRAENIFVG